MITIDKLYLIISQKFQMSANQFYQNWKLEMAIYNFLRHEQNINLDIISESLRLFIEDIFLSYEIKMSSGDIHNEQ